MALVTLQGTVQSRRVLLLTANHISISQDAYLTHQELAQIALVSLLVSTFQAVVLALQMHASKHYALHVQQEHTTQGAAPRRLGLVLLAILIIFLLITTGKFLLVPLTPACMPHKQCVWQGRKTLGIIPHMKVVALAAR
jgi:hypothetical protein